MPPSLTSSRRRLRLVAAAAAAAAALAACGLSPGAKDSLKTQLVAGGSGGGAVTDASGAGLGTSSGTTTTDTGSTSTGTSGTTAPTDTGAGAGSTGTGAGSTGTTTATGTGTSTATGTGTTGTGSGSTGTTATGSGTSTATGATATKGATPTKSTTSTKSGTTKTGTSGGTTPGGTSTGTGGGTGTAGASAACSTSGGNATGVTGSAINFGLHAPLTGTGTPFPNTSFQAGTQLFWKDPAHKICGRTVSPDFQDDQYTPTHARQVCESMNSNDLFIVGGAGTDQIQACASDPKLAATSTPYLSAGVTENGLTGLQNYFAVSLAYAQQGAIDVRAAQANGFATPAASTDGKQWAVVRGSGGNFDDATAAITAALNAAHISYTVFPFSQDGNYQAAATQLGTTLALKGYKTVWMDAAPGVFVYVTGGYYSQAPTGGVTWTGPGLTFTEMTVAELVCSGSHNAIDKHAFYLAPGPGLDRATPDFTAAGGQDDIEWSLWGLSNALFQMLQKTAQGPLTRQSFLAAVNGGSFPGGVYPSLNYTSSHFGGTGAWLQQIACGQTEPGQNQPGTWTTVGNAPMAP